MAADRYREFANSGLGRGLVRRLGLPQPATLRRYTPGDPLVTGPVLLAGAGRAGERAHDALAGADVEVLTIATMLVRRYARDGQMVPKGPVMGLFEYVIVRIRDEIVAPAVGKKWVNTYTPLVACFFLFIVTANAIGLIPVFDLLALLNHTVFHFPEDALYTRLTHGGVTPTGNFNVTAALATVSFLAIIVAGTRAHGFVGHWKNMIPSGIHPALWVILIPIEVLGMFVRPFALTMRLAANMTGGHIAVLAVLSMIFIMAESTKNALVGLGMSLVALPLSVGVSVLEAVVVVPVQAYVFTLLTAVFIGMAIHAHH